MRIKKAISELSRLEAAFETVGAHPLAEGARAARNALRLYGDHHKIDLAAVTSAVLLPPEVDSALAVLSSHVAPRSRPLVYFVASIAGRHADAVTIREILDRLLADGAPVAARQPSPGVDGYVEALKNALHNSEKFPEIVARLREDPSISRADMVEIASQVVFRLAKSTSKKEALARIERLHDASESYAAKAKAMKGKSAA
jgi:hypothetical protein